MKLLDIVNGQWAIQPAKLAEIQQIYATHLRGEKIDIAGVEARLGRSLDSEPKGYAVVDGVAVLPIDGVIAKRANLFTQISGGTSSELVARDLQQALDDDKVHSIVLQIDSPGGAVDGTQQLADRIFAARDIKPIVALADGTMASAAYWIGSAASKVYVADGTSQIGSIGVVAAHVDTSKAEQDNGVKTTEVYAGKYKRIASQYEPLSEEGRATLQAAVDYQYSIFVGAVATQRGVSPETVLTDMADGRVFIGEQAVAAGLVDGVSTLGALIAQLNQDRAGVALKPPSTPPKGTAMSLTRADVEAKAPDLANEFRAEGAAAERARIQGVESALLPGHEALIATLKFDGKSTAGDAALAVNAAERTQREKQSKAIGSDAPGPVALTPLPVVDKPAPAADASADPAAAKAAWDKSADLRAEFGGNYETYCAYVGAAKSGQVRVLKSKE